MAGNKKTKKKKNQKGMALGSVLCILFGILFCIWPGGILTILCRLAGLALLVFGAVQLFEGIREEAWTGRTSHLVPGVVCLIIGIWIEVRPGTFIVLIPIVIGIVLVVHGVQNIQYTMEIRRRSGAAWWSGLILAAVTIVIGLFMIFRAWKAIEVSMIFIGVVLIYDGVSNLFLNGRTGFHTGRDDDIIDID